MGILQRIVQRSEKWIFATWDVRELSLILTITTINATTFATIIATISLMLTAQSRFQEILYITYLFFLQSNFEFFQKHVL